MRRRRWGKDETPPLPPLKVTPAMRRKVENLARWLAAGDPAQIRAARAAIVELLRNASRQ